MTTPFKGLRNERLTRWLDCARRVALTSGERPNVNVQQDRECYPKVGVAQLRHLRYVATYVITLIL